MRNTTILKDEVSILKADKSAVKKELESLGKELRGIQGEISNAEETLADIKTEILLQTARRDEVRDRAVSLSEEVSALKQERSTWIGKTEVARSKNSQEEKLHLGRIRELKKEEEALTGSIGELKDTYDRNAQAMNNNLSDLNNRYRAVNDELNKTDKALKKAQDELKKSIDEDKKLTKERLKREDKIRQREKSLDRRERGIRKQEEDLETMAADLIIVYSRLKEAYPDVDIDKLITKAK